MWVITTSILGKKSNEADKKGEAWISKEGIKKLIQIWISKSLKRFQAIYYVSLHYQVGKIRFFN